MSSYCLKCKKQQQQQQHQKTENRNPRVAKLIMVKQYF